MVDEIVGVVSGFNLEGNIGGEIGYVRINKELSSAVAIMLARYKLLHNQTTPTVTHLIHSCIKYFLINGEKMSYAVNYNLDKKSCRTRSFNIHKDFVDYLPKSKGKKELLILNLMWNALRLHEKGELSQVLESV